LIPPLPEIIHTISTPEILKPKFECKDSRSSYLKDWSF
jgi:hypothetical protein